MIRLCRRASTYQRHRHNTNRQRNTASQCRNTHDEPFPVDPRDEPDDEPVVELFPALDLAGLGDFVFGTDFDFELFDFDRVLALLDEPGDL